MAVVAMTAGLPVLSCFTVGLFCVYLTALSNADMPCVIAVVQVGLGEGFAPSAATSVLAWQVSSCRTGSTSMRNCAGPVENYSKVARCILSLVFSTLQLPIMLRTKLAVLAPCEMVCHRTSAPVHMMPAQLAGLVLAALALLSHPAHIAPAHRHHVNFKSKFSCSPHTLSWSSGALN